MAARETQRESQRFGSYTFERMLVGTAQALIPLAIIAGVGAWNTARLNTAAIEASSSAMSSKMEILQTSVNVNRDAMIEFAKTLENVALINAQQTKDLEYLSRDIRECRAKVGVSR
jgi:hypothetical protein